MKLHHIHIQMYLYLTFLSNFFIIKKKKKTFLFDVSFLLRNEKVKKIYN